MQPVYVHYIYAYMQVSKQVEQEKEQHQTLPSFMNRMGIFDVNGKFDKDVQSKIRDSIG